MQFRLSLPLATTVSASGFKQGLSSILAGLTIAGAFSTVIFTTSITNNPLSNALDPIKKALASTPLYEGILRTAGTLKGWGASIVSSKDAFVDWFKRYFGADGLKTGVAQLYQKLRDWAEIVYRWFKDKFWTFINNIPYMVKNWDRLRLSLFKWGTFLGGGGGSALWAMFGSGENLGKLGELLNNPEFGEIAEKFSKLLEDNNSAFNEMSEEEAKEIFESILDDPAESKDTIDKLLKEQEELNKDKSKEAEEQKPLQEQQVAEEKKEKQELSKDRISEAFSKGGSPKSPRGVFKDMLSKGMDKLVNLSNSFFGGNIYQTAQKALKEYVDNVKQEVQNKATKTKAEKAKHKFVEALKDGKDTQFIESLTNSFVKAFQRAERNGSGKVKFEELSKTLGAVLEEDYTKACPDCSKEESVSLREEVPNKVIGK